MANSTPIDPRRLGQRSAGGFTPVDLKAGAANLRGTSKPKTPVPAPTPVREHRSKPRDYPGILRAARKSVVSGTRVSVLVELGGCRIRKKTTPPTPQHPTTTDSLTTL